MHRVALTDVVQWMHKDLLDLDSAVIIDVDQVRFVSKSNAEVSRFLWIHKVVRHTMSCALRGRSDEV